MKKTILGFSLLTLMISAFSSCDKKTNPAPADVNIVFKSMANGKEIVLGNQDEYTTDNGTKFIANVFKYYISKAKLVNVDGTEISLGNYSLIDAIQNGKRGFTFKNVPVGTYKSMVFNFGIDKTQNYNPAGVEDLNPATGMYWGPQAGYLFFRHEGKYTKTDGTKDNLLFHYGSDAGYVPNITIPLDNLEVSSNTKKINVALNIQKLYNNLDIKGRPFVMVDEAVPEDQAWVNFLSNNIKNSFELISVE